MEIKRIVAGIYAANCYVIWDETNEAVVLDPGGDVDDIYPFIQSKGLDVKYILLTHGHRDHTDGVDELKDLVKAPVCINERDDILMRNNEYMFGMLRSGKADINISDSDVLQFGNCKIKCLETPGHTPGGMSFLIGDSVFTGDSLFAMSIGRTDLPWGDYNALINSIKDKLFQLPDSTNVYPGHSMGTSIGYEKNNNPFFK
ncbi:MBL fold metallo-hydrolase [Haloimpatiens massiliensis]|uniref:MBL fold metallo-hydrolase n=1 Tax=Haloimpatiens massiliensis TaxID=1658110 RepID=UPI000C848BC6|nr:MBL fold metallo-hydrolase [Haloimpatiens massiliensis]